MIINLRGVRESGATFAIPTYFFLVMMVADGLHWAVRYASGLAGAGGGSAPDGTVHDMQASRPS